MMSPHPSLFTMRESQLTRDTEALGQKGHESSSTSALTPVSRLPPPLGVAAFGSVATAVRHELDVVRDDLGGMALLAVLAFPVAKGQFAEDNDRLALL